MAETKIGYCEDREKFVTYLTINGVSLSHLTSQATSMYTEEEIERL